MYLLNSKNNIQKVHVSGLMLLTRFLYKADAQLFNMPKQKISVTAA